MQFSLLVICCMCQVYCCVCMWDCLLPECLNMWPLMRSELRVHCACICVENDHNVRMCMCVRIKYYVYYLLVWFRSVPFHWTYTIKWSIGAAIRFFTLNFWLNICDCILYAKTHENFPNGLFSVRFMVCAYVCLASWHFLSIRTDEDEHRHHYVKQKRE